MAQGLTPVEQRDEFAGLAMQALASRVMCYGKEAMLAQVAYTMADAMMKVRAQTLVFKEGEDEPTIIEVVGGGMAGV